MAKRNLPSFVKKPIDLKKIGYILARVFSVIVFLWILFVFIPDLFDGIFHTFLGNTMLICIVLLVSLRNIVFALCLAVLFFLLFRLSCTGVLQSATLEGMKNKKGQKAKKAKIRALKTSVRASQAQAKASQAEAKASKAEAKASKDREKIYFSYSGKATEQAEQARKHAEQATEQAEHDRAEADQARLDAEQARAEAEQARAEAEQYRAEAEKYRAEAEQAREKNMSLDLVQKVA